MPEDILIMPWIAIVSSLSCSLVTGLVVHYLTKSRDIDARAAIEDREGELRRKHFRRFVRKCRYILERTRHDDPELVWSRYCDLAPDILAESALVEGDFPEGLIPLVEAAGNWRREDAEQKARERNSDLRSVLRDSIKQIDDFIGQ